MNWINRSEKVFAEPAPNDEKHPRVRQTEAKEYGPGSYETAVQRGINTSTQWTKKVGDACPYAVLPPRIDRPEVVASVSLQVVPPKKNSYLYQRGLGGTNFT